MSENKEIPEKNNNEKNASAYTSNNENSPTEIKKSRNWLVYLGIALLLIAIGVGSWLGLSGNNKNSLNSTVAVQPSPSVSLKNNQSVQDLNIPNAINPINPVAIPLGTGKVSTSPKVGYVDLCSYKAGSVAAEPNLPWINAANNTWNSDTKPAVQGSVSWANQASFTDKLSGSTRTISTNDLPINHDTGVFPISTTDPAYQYDHNPNHITAQPTTWQLPANPTAAASPSCTRDGAIGVLNDGVFLFNALDAQNRDAGATEILDQWQGHPQSNGMYHHHTVPNFMLKQDSAKSSSTLVGYALDGYGIYIERDANGNLLTNANLDACHGRTSEVMWNGKMTDMYHYDVTLEYPYTVGCFHGTPISIIRPNSNRVSTNTSGPRPPAPR